MDIALKLIFTFFLLLWSVKNISAQEDVAEQSPVIDMIPANILAGEKPLHSLIPFPDAQGDVNIYLRCEANISVLGGFKSSFCYNEAGVDKSYIDVVLRATSVANSVPAKVDNKNVDVWMPFSVVFQQKGDLQSISVFPNHLIYLNEYGPGYTAPQRYSSGTVRFQCYQRQRSPIRILQEINNLGQVVKVTLLETGQSIRCKSAVERKVLSYKYIPAMNQGIYVQGSIDEYAFNKEFIE